MDLVQVFSDWFSETFTKFKIILPGALALLVQYMPDYGAGIVFFLLVSDLLLGVLISLERLKFNLARLRHGIWKCGGYFGMLLLLGEMQHQNPVLAAAPLLKLASNYIISFIVVTELLSVLQNFNELASLHRWNIPWLDSLIGLAQAYGNARMEKLSKLAGVEVKAVTKRTPDETTVTVTRTPILATAPAGALNPGTILVKLDDGWHRRLDDSVQIGDGVDTLPIGTMVLKDETGKWRRVDVVGGGHATDTGGNQAGSSAPEPDSPVGGN